MFVKTIRENSIPLNSLESVFMYSVPEYNVMIAETFDRNSNIFSSFKINGRHVMIMKREINVIEIRITALL